MKRHEKHAVEKLKSGNFNFFLKLGLSWGFMNHLINTAITHMSSASTVT